MPSFFTPHLICHLHFHLCSTIAANVGQLCVAIAPTRSSSCLISPPSPCACASAATIPSRQLKPRKTGMDAEGVGVGWVGVVGAHIAV